LILILLDSVRWDKVVFSRERFLALPASAVLRRFSRIEEKIRDMVRVG